MTSSACCHPTPVDSPTKTQLANPVTAQSNEDGNHSLQLAWQVYAGWVVLKHSKATVLKAMAISV